MYLRVAGVKGADPSETRILIRGEGRSNADIKNFTIHLWDTTRELYVLYGVVDEYMRKVFVLRDACARELNRKLRDGMSFLLRINLKGP